jgi:hypothetical protein
MPRCNGHREQWKFHCYDLTNRVMTLFTSLGPSADCRGPTQVTTYQGRTDNARMATFSVSRRGSSLG